SCGAAGGRGRSRGRFDTYRAADKIGRGAVRVVSPELSVRTVQPARARGSRDGAARYVGSGMARPGPCPLSPHTVSLAAYLVTLCKGEIYVSTFCICARPDGADDHHGDHAPVVRAS